MRSDTPGLTVAPGYDIPARGRPAQGRGAAKNQEDRPAAGLNPAIACYHAASQHQAASNPKQLSSREARPASHETSFTTRLDPEPRAARPVALAVAARPPPVANGDRQEHAPAGQRDRPRRRPDHERDPLTITGNLVDDPELRFTPSGQPVAKFRIASTPRYFDKQANAWKDGE